ncbi:deoxyguanosinetriphosphate triphosphohydrolase [Suttonella ornithocola]|uniref:Deoxyguanosinetriphosphate triphosphohydrolase n=1 Tax=Suttonella ornithocola TaxID=279832 RepID=A0A380N1K4_9GAMM|nr:deoxyguanosinetriphosphate triphosphohydrolase [Suttonella ornithocola]SUO97637.1 Deoxyguanosinetriphosphate triphosphohydrolase [Suttonella ornithocola]
MSWEKCFSTARIGQAAQPEPSVRSEFQRDVDRILFSAAFRRMQDKTQVFPLEKNDYVRTRLTHSLEVSCVGRSLGSSAGEKLLQNYPELRERHIQASDVGDIVAAACLAHDLGNPPFGHSGEQAMCDFFTSEQGETILNTLHLSDAEKMDLQHIEGNAQGFRITNRLESPDNQGGLRLTATTLAAAAKYPTTAAYQAQSPYKKNGVYQDDLTDYSHIFSLLELPLIGQQTWQRHPLSFLMEAADDICYLIADIEDAYQVGQMPFNNARELLGNLADNLIDPARLNRMKSKSDQLAYLRAKAIGRLVHETLDIFWQNENALLEGRHHQALLESIPSRQSLEALRTYAQQYIYICRPVLEVQIAGHRILNGLIDIFCTAAMHTLLAQHKAPRHYRMIMELLPSRYHRHAQSHYQHLLAICDYITGMTDSYAVSLYKKLTGISLPVD